VDSKTSEILCRRCKARGPALERPPFKGERGDRIQASICRSCWGEWLQHQTLLINHYGLDPRDPASRDFLYRQIDDVLLGDGEAEQVDTSRKGTIDWQG
jgi:Fe-S cluster biosynthesis and repair protein YggX